MIHFSWVVGLLGWLAILLLFIISWYVLKLLEDLLDGK